MMTLHERADHIRNTWFTEHKATYTDHGDLKVLVWKKEGTISYYVRYVFDGSKLYVAGDVGEAVFCFTEKADVFIQCQYDLDYFEGKLQAYHGEKKDFNPDKALKRLREWLNELKENQVEYDHDDMRDFFAEARECSKSNDWAFVINNHDFISDMDSDYWEWMYRCGEETPMRLQSYLIGIKMAAEQLRIRDDVTA